MRAELRRILASCLAWTLVVSATLMGEVSTSSDSSRNNRKQPTYSEPIDVRDLTPSDEANLIEYLRTNSKNPTEYLIEKFRNHDVIMLGEMHEVRENLEFISSLIEPLYHRAGVRCLATEFLRHRNTDRANEIVTAKKYDEVAVVELYRDFCWTWGYKEYMDIFKAVWRLNKSLPPESEKFRILGLDFEYEEYNTWPGTKGKKITLKEMLERDTYMASTLVKGITASEKVLIHTGLAHALYMEEPFVFYGREWPARMGGILHKRYGERIFQICLHQQHLVPEMFTGGKPGAPPVLIDRMEELLRKTGNKPAGFDIENSPFARLRDRRSLYFAVDEMDGFADVTQGYVFLKPLQNLHKVTWVDGFINETNFEKARIIAETRGWIAMAEKRGLIKAGQCNTPEGLDRFMKLLLTK